MVTGMVQSCLKTTRLTFKSLFRSETPTFQLFLCAKNIHSSSVILSSLSEYLVESLDCMKNLCMIQSLRQHPPSPSRQHFLSFPVHSYLYVSFLSWWSTSFSFPVKSILYCQVNRGLPTNPKTVVIWLRFPRNPYGTKTKRSWYVLDFGKGETVGKKSRWLH